MLRTPRCTARRPRPGFTLVELMVAAAISVMIMAVLATAFQMGIDTMRQMRSAADLATQLRAAQEVVRRDLSGDIFVAEDGKPNNGLRVNNQRFDLNDNSVSPPKINNNIPIGGYMFILSPASLIEGADTDTFMSTVATNHVLQFTSVLKNNSEQNVFTAVSPPAQNGTFPPQTYTSPAAEIAYFLAPPPGMPQAFTTAAGGNPIPLFNLYRRQRLVARTADDAVAYALTQQSDPSPGDVISWTPPPPPAGPGPNPSFVNTMETLSLATPVTRLQVSPATTPFQPGSARFGEDVLLSNVISFEVKVNWFAQPKSGLANPRGFGTPAVSATAQGQQDIVANGFSTTSDFPFDTLAAIPGNTFDTTIFSQLMNGTKFPTTQIRVLALQIRIRVYDPKMNNARQITIVQPL